MVKCLEAGNKNEYTKEADMERPLRKIGRVVCSES